MIFLKKCYNLTRICEGRIDHRLGWYIFDFAFCFARVCGVGRLNLAAFPKWL